VSPVVLSACLAALHAAAADPAPPSPDQARRAVEKSLPFLEKEGVAWIEGKKCISCHHVAFMVWGLEEARHSKISVDEKKLNEWDNWSLANAPGNGVEGMGQMILARLRSGADDRTQAAVKKLGETMVAQQKPEGFWAAGGQLPSQKRPQRETIEVSTMWTVFALAVLDERGKPDEARVKSREKALKWLKDAKPGVSNEWHVVRLLVERQCGDANKAEAQLKDLLAAQQADGGWGWLRGDASDALATGQTLYALSVLGVPNTDPAVRRAWKFLLDTQGENGSWQVKGTKENAKTKVQPTSSYWGTAWAAIGLSRSLAAGEAKPAG
jgi:squalene-hopene/tetraprenyl-beta-curcumene cyclase